MIRRAVLACNIHTLFGTAMHTVIQEYLSVMYNKSIVAADKLNMESRLKEEMVTEFTKIKEDKGVLPCTQDEMMEFYQDGLAILNTSESIVINTS